MGTAQKIGLGIVGIGMATAVLLPDRQTVPVLGALRQFFTGSLHTAITGNLT